VGGACANLNGASFESSSSASEKAAKAFGVLAALLGGVAVFAQLSMCCIKTNEKSWYAIGFALAICTVFQSFTFIIFNSPRCKEDFLLDLLGKCNLDEGGAASISAMLFYIFASVGVFLVPAPSGEPLFNCSGLALTHSQEPLRTVTEVINSDGSKTVFITTTAAPNVPYIEKIEEKASPSPIAQIEHDEENPSGEIQETEETKPSGKEKLEEKDIDVHVNAEKNKKLDNSPTKANKLKSMLTNISTSSKKMIDTRRKYSPKKEEEEEVKEEKEEVKEEKEEERKPSEVEETESVDKFCDESCDDTSKIYDPSEENEETKNIKVVEL